MKRIAQQVLQQYLSQAAAINKTLESELRSFAEAAASAEAGDDEVRRFLSGLGESAAREAVDFGARVDVLGGPLPPTDQLASATLSLPSIPRTPVNAEERVVKTLITSFAICNAKRTFYATLSVVAKASGDAATSTMAESAALREEQNAAKAWSLLPSRSKIAFNVSTAGEVDPAIATKASAARII